MMNIFIILGKFRRDFRVAHLDYPCTCGFYAQGN